MVSTRWKGTRWEYCRKWFPFTVTCGDECILQDGDSGQGGGPSPPAPQELKPVFGFHICPPRGQGHQPSELCRSTVHRNLVPTGLYWAFSFLWSFVYCNQFSFLMLAHLRCCLHMHKHVRGEQRRGSPPGCTLREREHPHSHRGQTRGHSPPLVSRTQRH